MSTLVNPFGQRLAPRAMTQTPRSTFLRLASLVLFVLAMPACAGSIDGKAAHELVAQKGALLLDVRTPDEFGAGHLEGAINVPVQVLSEKLTSLPAKKDQDIVVYCRSGARSSRASSMLKEAGFTKVHDLGGMSNWR
jgi:phage shock protein E